MSDPQIYTGALAMVLAAVGMWLMLPRGDRPGRLLGAVIGVASLVLFGALGARMGTTGSEVAFATLAAVTIIAAAATVTFRSPVYCALWFALSLLGTAGLFLMQGAQFLGVATIVVYAGAILVTFLFVLMLAQPGGHAYYDRVSWEGMFAASTGAVIVGFLTMTVVRVLNPYVDPTFVKAIETFRPEESGGLEAAHVHRARLMAGDDGIWTMGVELSDDAPVLTLADHDRLKMHLLDTLPALEANQVSKEDFELVVTSAQNPLLVDAPADRAADGSVLADEHVATLGAQLFSRHLIAIEVAGTLLLVALVGAIAIVNHERPLRQAFPREAAAGHSGRS
jgi:NADH:ubiquinone oxidoreductase subunit 6 (subunit J)